MSYAFQQDVVLLLSPILHRMLLFANVHPECRNKYRRAAVLPSPEGLQLSLLAAPHLSRPTEFRGVLSDQVYSS